MRQTLQQRYVGARKARIADQIEAEARNIKLLAEENKWADLRAAEIALSCKKFGILGEDDQIIYGMFAEVGDATARPDDEDAIKRLAALRKAGEPFCTKRKAKKRKSAAAPEIPQPAPVNDTAPAGSAKNDAQGDMPKASGGKVGAPLTDDGTLIDRPPAAPAAPEGTALGSMDSAPDGAPSSPEILPASASMTVVPPETLGASLAGATTEDAGDVIDPVGQGSVTAEGMTPISAEDAPQANVVLADGEPVSPAPTDAAMLIPVLPTPTGTPSSSQIVPASGTVTSEPTETVSDPPTEPTMTDPGDAIDPGDQGSVTAESAPQVLATAKPPTPPRSEPGPTAASIQVEELDGAHGALATDQPPGAISLDAPSAATEHHPPMLDTASAGEPLAKSKFFGKTPFGGRGGGKGPPPK